MIFSKRFSKEFLKKKEGLHYYAQSIFLSFHIILHLPEYLRLCKVLLPWSASFPEVFPDLFHRTLLPVPSFIQILPFLLFQLQVSSHLLQKLDNTPPSFCTSYRLWYPFRHKIHFADPFEFYF